MSYYYNDYNEKKTYQNVESGQLIQLKKTATNVVESGKVIVCPEKKNHYRPIPSPPPEPHVYQESSPTCASGITYLSRRKGSHQQSEHLIQIYEIAPNNIIKFLSDWGLNRKPIFDWDEDDVSNFLRHPSLNLMPDNILEYLKYRYCVRKNFRSTCCFNHRNINGLLLIYICLGSEKFHYYTENQFLNFNQYVETSLNICSCVNEFRADTFSYNNNNQISEVVERICHCFQQRKKKTRKLLNKY